MPEKPWPENDIRRAFVAGARWRHRESGLTWWRYVERQAEEEAEKRFGYKQKDPTYHVDVGESFASFQDHLDIGIVIYILNNIARNSFRGQVDG